MADDSKEEENGEEKWAGGSEGDVEVEERIPTVEGGEDDGKGGGSPSSHPTLVHSSLQYLWGNYDGYIVFELCIMFCSSILSPSLPLSLSLSLSCYPRLHYPLIPTTHYSAHIIFLPHLILTFPLTAPSTNPLAILTYFSRFPGPFFFAFLFLIRLLLLPRGKLPVIFLSFFTPFPRFNIKTFRLSREQNVVCRLTVSWGNSAEGYEVKTGF
jgi:hypothetical protein